MQSTLASRNILAATPSRLPGVSRAGETVNVSRARGYIPNLAGSIFVERESFSVIQVEIEDTEVIRPRRSDSSESTGLDTGLKRPEAAMWA